MAHWGLAYALGPNYNKPWEAFDQDRPVHVGIARIPRPRRPRPGWPPRRPRWSGHWSHALAARYPSRRAVRGRLGVERRVRRRHARRSTGRIPDDLDVAALFADALMNLTPWALWDQITGEPADGAATAEAKAVLDRALAAPGGPGPPRRAAHVHPPDGDVGPARGRAARPADRLSDLVPDAGHLRHMPTHLDVLCGDYRRWCPRNTAAIEADEKFLALRGAMNFYTLYRAHNYHFKIYGAMFLGQSQTALDTADQLAAAIPEELLRVEVPPMADWLEGFVPMKMHVLIRFGRWARHHRHTAARRPGPVLRHHGDDCTTPRASRTRPAASSARPAAHQQQFAAAAARVPDSRTLFNNTCQDILQIAAAMLDGELEYRTGELRRRLRRTCAGRSSSTTGCPTTSRGAGCSRPGTPTAPCCWSRTGSPKPRPCTGPTSAWTARCPGPASIRATCGACTATTSA